MTPAELAKQLRELRAKAQPGECWVNNQEWQSCLMLKDGSFFGDFENPADAELTAFIFNHALAIAAALETNHQGEA